jgi:hypothetical protein
MKTVETVRDALTANLLRRLPELVAEPETQAWPWRIPLGRPTGDAVDVEILLNTADWLRQHPTPDETWTPRMVPVPGLHAKWLDLVTRRRLVADLAGLDQLNLRQRPAQVHITYLDPEWSRAGGRRFDVITADDPNPVPYPPRVVIVSENRDTALYFPPVTGGVAVRGDGDRILRSLPETMLRDAPNIIYWGDLDVDGLEIVNGLRARGIRLRTLFMDIATYDAYERFGTSTDRRGAALRCLDRKPLAHLTPAENALYERLTDPGWKGYRRIEQERIPLALAGAAVAAIMQAHNLTG